jgi:hypothetical protein
MAEIMAEQADLLTFGLSSIAVLVAAVLLYSLFTKRPKNSTEGNQGVVKREWCPTSRIDFATPGYDVANDEQPQEFRLLVEEQRVVESIAGSENLEIQWRHATLREAKAVVTNYHKYLSDNLLDKPGLALVPPMPKQTGTEYHELRDLDYAPSPPLSPRASISSDVETFSQLDHRR